MFEIGWLVYKYVGTSSSEDACGWLYLCWSADVINCCLGVNIMAGVRVLVLLMSLELEGSADSLSIVAVLVTGQRPRTAAAKVFHATLKRSRVDWMRNAMAHVPAR